jgi:hypothetical protein
MGILWDIVQTAMAGYGESKKQAAEVDSIV